MFPHDLVDEILVRLPVKSLMRFKCVDPSWKDLFKRPSFISKNMYHKRKERVMVFERGFHGMMISADNYEESECLPFPDDLMKISVIGGGSYNGVFCSQRSIGDQLYFWNPSTREFSLVSPPPYSYIEPCYDTHLCCFDFRNNQFGKLDRPPQNYNVGFDFLAEINNSIAYVVRRKHPSWGVDIWILEEEGCCWTKRYIFEPLDGPLLIYTIWKDGAEFLGPSRYQQFYFHRDDKQHYFCRDDKEPVYLASYNSAGQLVHCFRQPIPLSRFLKYVESIAPLSFS